METRGAQFSTIAAAVSEKYFVAINRAKIAKFPDITLITSALTHDLSMESYKTYLKFVLWYAVRMTVLSADLNTSKMAPFSSGFLS